MDFVEIFVLNYNGGSELEETLESLFAQTYPHKKIILSDNGSTDDSVQRAQKFVSRGLEIRLRNPPSGDCYSHYNLCIPEITAPFVAFFHNDDVYTPRMVELQMKFLAQHPSIDAVMTAGLAVNSKTEPLWPIQLPSQLKSPVLDSKQAYEYTIAHGSSFWICPSALLRSDVFKKLGMVRADYPYCGDLELWFRILLKGGGIGYLNEPLIHYRLSESQGSSVYEITRTDPSEFFRMVDPYLEKFPVGPEVRARYEALRHLDLFQVGLNRLVKTGDKTMYASQLRWLTAKENRDQTRAFGFVDRLKILGARLLHPALMSSVGPKVARLLIRHTTPLSAPWLRFALKAKRSLARSRSHSPQLSDHMT